MEVTGHRPPPPPAAGENIETFADFMVEKWGISPEDAKDAFESSDKNDDGVLNRREFAEAHSALGLPPPGKGDGPPPGRGDGPPPGRGDGPPASSEEADLTY